MKSLFTRRVWIALSTLVVVSVCFAYYFLIYIPDNEAALVNEKFRVLQRIGENFIGMKSDLENSLDIIIRDCQQSKEDSIKRIVAEMLRDYPLLSPSSKIQGWQGKIVAVRNQDCGKIVTESLRQLKIEPEPLHSPGDRLPLKYRETNKGYVFLKSYRYKTKLLDFITNPSLINHQFDRFLIIRMLKDTATSTHTAVVAYQGTGKSGKTLAENKIILSKIGLLFDSSQGLITVPMRTVDISGTSSRIFPYVLEFNQDEDWILVGLIKERDIQTQSRSIDLAAIIFLILTLLFLLLSMPTLKLFIMNNIERLQVINVWFAGCSVVLGTALLTILFLVAHHFVDYRNIYEERLMRLSNSIKVSFTAEIETIVNQMKCYGGDQAALQELEIKTTESQPYPQIEQALLTEPGRFANYPFFNEFLLLNPEGEVPIVFATHPLPPAKKLPDLSKRTYFTDSRDKNLTALLDTGYSQAFAIQSIRSWTSGKNEAGVSIPWDVKLKLKKGEVEVVVLATATKLKSVMAPLLPPGYHFCVVNGFGDVLFHSTGSKNLQENFFDEVEQDYLSRATIEGRLSKAIALTYSGKKHLAYFQPLDTKDMYLITLLDMDYYNTPIVLTFGFVWILTSILLLIQGLQLAFLFCLTRKTSNLLIKRFFLNWLRPRGLTENALQHYFKESYSRAIAAMLMISFVLILVCVFSSSRYVAVAYLTLPIILFAAHYSLLYQVDPEINSRRHRNVFVVTAILCFCVLTITAALNIPAIARLRFLSLELLIVGILLVNVSTNLLAPFHRWILKTVDTFNLYTCFMCLWLFLISILPIFYFYKASFHHEYFLWSKFIQCEAFKTTIAREEALVKEFDQMALFPDNAVLDRDSLRAMYLTESNKYGYYLFTDSTIMPYVDKTDTLTYLKNTVIEEIEFRVRPRFYGPMENSRFVLLNGQNAAKWYARASRSNIVLNDKNSKIFYSSKIPTFKIFTGDYAALLIAGFILSLSGIYFIVKFSVKHIFGWGRVSSKIENHLSVEKLKNRFSETGNIPVRLFIVGLPYGGKYEFLQALIKVFPAYEIHLRSAPNAAVNYVDYKLIIIHNFEHGINNNKELNEDRLKLIQGLQTAEKVPVIISSAVQPELILEILEVKIKRLVNEKKSNDNDKGAIDKELADLRNSYRIWKNILSEFEIYYYPLMTKASSNFIEKELYIGNFLPRLESNFTTTAIENEDALLAIEEMAQGHYHGLWNSFSRLEKHMLFDLAKDGFVNMRDLSKIRLLILKGVVVMDDAPRIMNKSFNNFILSVVKEDEELAMTNEMRRKGSWFSIQIILIIALISITVFIALVQQEILSNVDALVATVSGVIALLMRFSGIFSGSQGREIK